MGLAEVEEAIGILEGRKSGLTPADKKVLQGGGQGLVSPSFQGGRDLSSFYPELADTIHYDLLRAEEQRAREMAAQGEILERLVDETSRGADAAEGSEDALTEGIRDRRGIYAPIFLEKERLGVVR